MNAMRLLLDEDRYGLATAADRRFRRIVKDMGVTRRADLILKLGPHRRLGSIGPIEIGSRLGHNRPRLRLRLRFRLGKGRVRND